MKGFVRRVCRSFVLRHAIKEMVVRGAPAIAIAAALSLAVEVSRFDAFSGTNADAASFLIGKLDYLVSRYCGGGR